MILAIQLFGDYAFSLIIDRLGLLCFIGNEQVLLLAMHLTLLCVY